MEDWNWITFRNSVALTERIVELGGRCAAMLDELTSHPVKPHVAAHLRTVLLSKGLHGTTAIEGNTLSVEQVRKIIDASAPKYPPSRVHLQNEILNVVAAYKFMTTVADEQPHRILHPSTILETHRQIATGLEQIEAVPGALRTGKVVVGSVYVAPPATQVAPMLDSLNSWLTDQIFAKGRLLDGVIRAIVAHVYLAWIHPFDDGSGRTARTLEYGLLQVAGLPEIGAVLLANHYNLTRDLYMQQLRRTSREHGGDLTQFVEYALQGLRDSLDEALQAIRSHSMNVAWENYIYERFNREFGRGLSKARARARSLALWLTEQETPLTRRAIEQAQSGQYTPLKPKTLTRDLQILKSLGVIVETSRGKYAPNKTIMHAFRMRRSESDDGVQDDEPQIGLFPDR